MTISIGALEATDMNMRLSLLQWELTAIGRWLGSFTSTCPPRVGLERSGQTMWVKDFPLPDHFRPDRVSLALVVDKYPVEPPKGLYLLSEDRRRFISVASSAFDLDASMRLPVGRNGLDDDFNRRATRLAAGHVDLGVSDQSRSRCTVACHA